VSDMRVETRPRRLGPELGRSARLRPTEREHRTAATTAGVLYIIGTVAGIFSKVITYFPVHDPLAYAAEHSDAVATGSETMSAGSGTDSPAGVRLGALPIDADGADAVRTLILCFAAVLFYALLYGSRIVPRWITVWGLVGIPFYAAANVPAMYGVIEGNCSRPNLLLPPVFVQGMVLAVWMTARGLRPTVVSPREPASGTRGAVS
jgi:Domain of unknown function (DUF4386)